MSAQNRFSDEFKKDAVAERFFQLLKRERIRRKTYLTRDDARRDVFEYIEMFYNPKRKHTKIGRLNRAGFAGGCLV